MKTASLGALGKVVPSDHSGTFVEVRKWRNGHHLSLRTDLCSES